VACVIFASFVGLILQTFPWWISPVFMVGFVMCVFRAVSVLFLSQRSDKVS
jgi:hypothetical protein